MKYKKQSNKLRKITKRINDNEQQLGKLKVIHLKSTQSNTIQTIIKFNIDSFKVIPKVF